MPSTPDSGPSMICSSPVRADAGDVEVHACRVFDIKEELSITVGGTSKLVDRIEPLAVPSVRANPVDRARRSSSSRLPGGGCWRRRQVFETNCKHVSSPSSPGERWTSSVPR